MPAVANVDGEIGPLADARVPVTDRGFLWGDHAFEILLGELRAAGQTQPVLEEIFGHRPAYRSLALEERLEGQGLPDRAGLDLIIGQPEAHILARGAKKSRIDPAVCEQAPLVPVTT